VSDDEDEDDKDDEKKDDDEDGDKPKVQEIGMSSQCLSHEFIEWLF